MRVYPGIVPALLLLPALAAAAPEPVIPNVCGFNPAEPDCFTCGVSADVNGDGFVNGADLGVLLGSWGPVMNGGSPADFNRDGTVSCFDQKFLLGNWGECPLVETDLDGDGGPGLGDVAILLDSYGSCAHPVPGAYCPFELPLDLDNNGRIDQNDVDIVACFFGQPLPAFPDVDFNRNGVADAADQQAVRDAMGQTCPYDLNQNGLVEWTDIRVIIEKGLQ